MMIPLIKLDYYVCIKAPFYYSKLMHTIIKSEEY